MSGVWSIIRQLAGASLLLFYTGLAGHAAEPPPVADVHLHFNWDHEEQVSAQEAVRRLRTHNVVLGVVSSVPSANALKLREAGGRWILPFFSPYITGRDRNTWFVNDEVLVRARAALESGNYFGIGELHLVSGLGPRRDNKILLGLVDLARVFDVPVLVHTDASSYRYLLPLCRAHSKVRFLWAHGGGILGPRQIGALMAACPNVWVELSARDPWHYGGLTDARNRLLPGWLELFTRYPQRFMIGTDPVWNAHQVYRWYEADEGWDHYGQLQGYHRAWLRQLPEELREQLRLGNARRFLRTRTRAELVNQSDR